MSAAMASSNLKTLILCVGRLNCPVFHYFKLAGSEIPTLIVARILSHLPKKIEEKHEVKVQKFLILRLLQTMNYEFGKIIRFIYPTFL